MGWLDKLLGRGKQAAGGAAGSTGMQEEGRHQEAAGMAEDQAERAEDMAQDARERAAEERASEENM
ncbi:MAG TPA: hypothetical protein VFW80_12260 [Gaiellaceae bacterium]|nr:hypothetical protein [Gaiellaceae bacterium]